MESNIKDKEILEIQNLTVQFSGNKKPLFSNINFSVPYNSIFGIFGETGCGKSTLAQCIMGFIPLDYIKGKILLNFNGDFINTTDSEADLSNIYGKKIVYIPQDPYKTLNPFEKVGKQLLRVLKFHKNQAHLKQILTSTQLSKSIMEFYPRELSAGQCQRAMLACALAANPDILILDEPTASIDAQARSYIVQTFKTFLNNKKTLVIISHELHEYNDLIHEQNRFYFNEQEEEEYIPKHIELENSQKIIKLENIRKSFGGKTVLEDINLEVGLNRWIYIEGRNGCGKTTLLNILLGFEKPNRGKFHWRDKIIKWKNLNSKIMEFFHPVFQDVYQSFNPSITIFKSLEEVIEKIKPAKKDQLKNLKEFLFQHLELSNDLLNKFPHQLSYGQQKRLALLRTILKYQMISLKYPNAVHLFLFDEIFSGIHSKLRSNIINFLEDLRNERNFSIIWIAHAQPNLKELCDITYELKNGELV